MDTVFVTGADGFIGSHLVESLVGAGYKVRALSLYNSFGNRGWLDHIPNEILREVETISGDIRDHDFIFRSMKGCGVVAHLASLIAIPYSYVAPHSYIDTNINGTLGVLQAARHHGVTRFLQTSTSEVYGTARYVPIDEAHPLQGQSPYSASKIGADQLAFSFFSSFDLPVVIVRPFNTYGPRQSARAVIPTIISQIANGNKSINLGSVTPTRDFSYVQDTVDGFLSVIKSEGGLGEVFNFGSNFEISILELAKLIAKQMKEEVEIQTDQIRLRPNNSEVERLWADNSKAKKTFGWGPKYAGVEGLSRGLKKTIEWFLEVENLKKYKADTYNV